jgi:hypothetical protein
MMLTLSVSMMLAAAYCSAPKPYDWLSNKVAPYVWKTTCYGACQKSISNGA